MPYNSMTLEVGITNQAQEILSVEGGRLVAVMMGPERTGSGNAEFFGQIFLASTEIPHPVPIAQLAAGYFGASVFISWTGSIIMQPTYAVFARIWSVSAIPVRCTMITEEVS